MPERKLTEKQRRFVEHYVELGNQAEAAFRAGYTKKNSRSASSKLMDLPHIQAAIQERMASKDNAVIASQDEILGFLTSVMRGEVLDQIPLLAGDGFQSLERLDETQPKDRIRAAELLGKRYGMWTDKKEVSGEVGVVIVDDIGGDDDE